MEIDAALLAATFDQLNEPTVVADCKSGRIVMANQAAAKMVGRTPQSVIGRSLADFSADPARAGDYLRMRRPFVPLRFVRAADGSHTAVEIRIRYLAQAHEGLAVMSFRDITERTKLERSQLETDQRYQAIFAHSPYPMLLIAADGIISAANPCAESAYGFVDGSVPLVGLGIDALFQDKLDLSQVLFEKRPTHWPGFWHSRRDGTRFFAEVSLAYVRLKQQPYVIAVIHDLTEIQAFVDKLTAAEQRWRFALEGAGDLVWEWRLDDHTLTMPHSLHPADAGAPLVASRTLLARFVHPEEFAAVSAALRRHLGGLTPLFVGECRVRQPDGDYRWMLCRGKVMEESGNAAGRSMIGTLRDIHDARCKDAIDRQRQSELAHAGRLIAMGEMSSMLAHELSQPLTAIRNFSRVGTRYLDASTSENPALADTLAMIHDQACRASEMLNRIRGFGRKTRQRQDLFDLRESIDRTLAMIRFEADASSVALSASIKGRHTLVRADQLQIEQVLLNLLRNAVEAVRALPSPREVGVSVAPRQGRALITIEDNGPGIGACTQDELCAPFFTTKQEGLGLGLTICASIIESHGCTLALHPKPGGGLRASFSLQIMEPHDV